MDKISIFREEQLKAAMQLQEMGGDPDQIMVTYSPEEFHQLYAEPEEPYFEIAEENIDLFPACLLGSSSPLKCHDLSVNAFSNPFTENIIDLYNKIIRRALARFDEKDYTSRQLLRQIDIQDVLANAIQAAVEYYTEEFESDQKAYEETTNSLLRSELLGDIRHSRNVLDKVILTKQENDGLTSFLQELLNGLRKT